jgi:hypothetical protein
MVTKLRKMIRRQFPNKKLNYTRFCNTSFKTKNVDISNWEIQKQSFFIRLYIVLKPCIRLYLVLDPVISWYIVFRPFTSLLLYSDI